MSIKAGQAELAERVAKVWDRPRLKMDTATLLEVYPTRFSILVLGTIAGLLACAIGYFASQDAIARVAWAKNVPAPAFILGTISVIVSMSGLLRMRSGKRQYKSPQEFADMVFKHVLGQPGAPNYHLYERVALPETLGLAPDRPEDDNDVPDTSDSLHAWMERSRAAISQALLDRAGITPEAVLFENAPVTAGEMIATKIQATLGMTRADGEASVTVDGTQATVHHFARSATFEFRAPQSVLGNLTPEGEKLASTAVQTVLHVSVVNTHSDAWYAIDAGIDEIKPGAAEDATEMV